MQSSNALDIRRKAIVVNVGIVLGLAFQYWRGTPVLILAVTGIFLFVLANLLMIWKANKTSAESR